MIHRLSSPVNTFEVEVLMSFQHVADQPHQQDVYRHRAVDPFYNPLEVDGTGLFATRIILTSYAIATHASAKHIAR